MMALQAAWTMMIYSNGNNDLEPEMRLAKAALEKVRISPDVKVVMQLGREEREFVTQMRPHLILDEGEERWTGVRRFLLEGGGARLLADLGRQNMADPASLYRFVKDSMAEFPAERYMVIIGGHGYQFVGSMPDYSQDAPYLMGFPGMALALDRACSEQGTEIDLLIADICYFNCIEVIYEFACRASHGVRHILTYICDGPVQGMPYDQIIPYTFSGEDSPKLIADCIAALNLDLVAFALDHHRLKAVKGAFHNLACKLLAWKEEPINLQEVLFVTDHSCPWFQEAKAALAGLESLIMAYKRISINDYGLLNIANVANENERARLLYSKLQFACGNDWTKLINGPALGSSEEQGDDFQALGLTAGEVFAYISLMNPTVGQEEKLAILDDIIAYKKWFGVQQ